LHRAINVRKNDNDADQGSLDGSPHPFLIAECACNPLQPGLSALDFFSGRERPADFNVRIVSSSQFLIGWRLFAHALPRCFFMNRSRPMLARSGDCCKTGATASPATAQAPLHRGAK
jgi:hypothetical protein